MQGRDLVVESVPTLVEAAQVLCKGCLYEGLVDFGNSARRRRIADGFDHVQQSPGIPVGSAHHQFTCFFGKRQGGKRLRERAREQFRQVFLGERLEDIHRRARQQCAIDLE